MNVTVIGATKRGNSSTYNGAKYLLSRMNDIEEIFEFALPDDCPYALHVSTEMREMWEIDNEYWKKECN